MTILSIPRPSWCRVNQDYLKVTSMTKDCVLEGSSHVQQLNLNERYNLDVSIELTWKDQRLMSSEGSLMVEVSNDYMRRRRRIIVTFVSSVSQVE